MKPKDLTSEIEKFLVHGARQITIRDIDRVREQLPAIRDRLKQSDAGEVPHLVEHFSFLANVFEDFVSGRFANFPYVGAAEVAFALQYLVRDVDVIPDFVEGIGLIDDATVAIVALKRNANALADHPKASAIDWDALS